MITAEINMIALAEAAKAVVGEEKSTEIAKLYRVLDDAMFAGYELGQAEGIKGSAEATEAAFDNGYEQGEEVGHDVGYDDGYLEGVNDARVAPAVADMMVVGIIEERGDGVEHDTFDPSEYTPVEDDEDNRIAFDTDPGYCEVCESYDCETPVKIGA